MTTKTVLLVEDVALNRDLMVQILEDKFHVLEATDGQEGIAMARAHQPDIILMDLSLPGLDGWEAIKRLKENARTRHIPIVALTAHAMLGDKERVLALGCEDYLTKPVDERMLFQMIEKHVMNPRR